MLSEKTIKLVLEALSDAGLTIADASILGPCHPGSISNHKYIIGRIEETGALG